MGRGSAASAAVAVTVLTLLYLLACTEQAEAASYTVGDSSGWTFNVATWPKGKGFKAGDVLVFNYSPGAHNVVAVNRGGYQSCNAPPRPKVFQSGKDQVKLVKGQNYFICSIPGHCQGGMKIAVTAA
ncbi:hypothetical protein CRG98_034568 [Punica granatum]|uniref:Basic blue protein n=1 Tax=Punica granatum TaxID=22663 RepID=A0A2I0INR3_PUNGR|nr:hypothetical protein CRG98_034568 [Punica granatum]